MAQAWRSESDGLLWLSVRVTPRARRDAIEGVWHDADGQAWLAVRVRAAPDDGAANTAVIATLAKALGVSRSSIELATGAASRLKRLKIVCITYEIEARLSALAGG